ncbi:hypothetical protein OIO90_001469 [Microbotryomycetes sp. JL221]|nr:hypothetical protein OIO90_001469 [Microbotryomycetes sp. JL221]
MPPDSTRHWLPFDLILAQLEQLDLCQSLYPQDDEFVLLTPSEAVDRLRHLVESPTTSRSQLETELEHASVPTELTFRIQLQVDERAKFELSGMLALTHTSIKDNLELDDIPPTKYNLHQPPWLSRTQHEQLETHVVKFINEQAPTSVLEVIDFVKEQAHTSHLQAQAEREAHKHDAPDTNTRGHTEPEWRVWFVLTSLSTREKRQDMVDWAPSYGLTGVVLAGKPALLILEGTTTNVDRYMSEIKSKSWSDVPSFQKKITERHRSKITERAFSDMQEITHLISRGGHRGNRGDMTEVRDFLATKGLADAFGLVLGNGSFI